MNGTHFTGGAAGALVAAILEPVLARYGVNLSDSTASLVGAGAASLGVGLAHIIATQGIWPAIKRIFVGPPPEPPPTPVVVLPSTVE